MIPQRTSGLVFSFSVYVPAVHCVATPSSESFDSSEVQSYFMKRVPSTTPTNASADSTRKGKRQRTAALQDPGKRLSSAAFSCDHPNRSFLPHPARMPNSMVLTCG